MQRNFIFFQFRALSYQGLEDRNDAYAFWRAGMEMLHTAWEFEERVYLQVHVCKRQSGRMDTSTSSAKSI